MTFTAFVPTKRNDGSPISRREMQAILNETARRFDGYTLGSLQRGAWVDPQTGKTYFDNTHPLVVNCDRSQLTAAREWVVQIGRRFDQKAMYFEVRDYDGVQILNVA